MAIKNKNIPAGRAPERIVILGKGGIGKSTIAANLSVLYALEGRRVLHVGCDPKSDSALLLNGGEGIPTVVELLAAGAPALKDIICRTASGIDCVESGGPVPGEGCAGMGILRTFEILEAGRETVEKNYDVVLFDVLGDIVCGGFAVPLRKGFGRKIVVVVSDDLMSLYAANNIARAIKTYSYTGARLVGLAANGVPAGKAASVLKFSKLINTRVLSECPRDPQVKKAEAAAAAAVEQYPRAPFSLALKKLKRALDAAPANLPLPEAVEGRDFFAVLAGRKTRRALAPAPASPAPAACSLPAEPAASFGARTAPSFPAAPGDGWKRFMAQDVFNSTCAVRYAGPQLYLANEDLECSAAIPRLEEEERLPFLRRPVILEASGAKLKPGGSSRLSTDLAGADVISGIGAKLAATAAAAKAGPKPDFIFMHTGCVAYAMGDDSGRWAEVLEAEAGAPVVASSHLSSCSFPANLKTFFGALAKARPRMAAKKPPRCVFMGYGESRGVADLKALVAAASGQELPWLLPEYDLDALKKFWPAGTAVISDSFTYDFLERAVKEHCGKSALRPASPFGFAGTAQWLRHVAHLCGCRPAMERQIAAELKKYEAPRALLRKRAAKHNVYFVAGADDARRLCSPALSAGIPMPDFLSEAGFGVKLLVHEPDQPAVSAVLAGGRLAKLPVVCFNDEADLHRKLAAKDCSAVFSDFLCDYRVAAAGKAQVSMDLFKFGFREAFLGAERLLALCESGFVAYGGK